MGSHSIRWLNDCIINWLVAEKAPTGMPLCNFERLRRVIQPCDVLLVEGRSRVSEVIKLITQSPWSHAAICIGSLNHIKDPEIRALVARHHNGAPEEQLIIEAIMDKGVVVTPLSEYKNQHLRICRPKGLSPWDTQKVIHFSVRHLGCDYDFRQIMDLARFLLPYNILPRRLGSSLFQHQAGANTRAVCSSMLARAFMSVRFPIIPVAQRDPEGRLRLYHRNFRLFTPRDFDVSPYFEIIKYPLLGHEDLANYRNLPWGQEGLVCNTAGDCFTPFTPEPIHKNPTSSAIRQLWQRWLHLLHRYFTNNDPIPAYPVANTLNKMVDVGSRASVPLSPPPTADNRHLSTTHKGAA